MLLLSDLFCDQNPEKLQLNFLWEFFIFKNENVHFKRSLGQLDIAVVLNYQF